MKRGVRVRVLGLGKVPQGHTGQVCAQPCTRSEAGHDLALTAAAEPELCEADRTHPCAPKDGAGAGPAPPWHCRLGCALGKAPAAGRWMPGVGSSEGSGGLLGLPDANGGLTEGQQGWARRVPMMGSWEGKGGLLRG